MGEALFGFCGPLATDVASVFSIGSFVVDKMLKLDIPLPLAQEFATVDALWKSGAETRRVDSLLLSWVKYEKQLRRLFCFLVYQHPRMTAEHISGVIAALAQNNRLYPSTFVEGVRQLGVTPIPSLVGDRYQRLAQEMDRIRRYRNKLMHGQVTGLPVRSRQLERDVKWIVDWVVALAVGAEAEFGYDGLRRNTFRSAKSAAHVVVSDYPFSGSTDFRSWLRRMSGD